jgi:hypothetical protein
VGSQASIGASAPDHGVMADSMLQRSWAITAPPAGTSEGLHMEPPSQQLQRMSLFDVNARLSCPAGGTLPFQQPLLPGLHLQRRPQDVDGGGPVGAVCDPLRGLFAGVAAVAGSAPMVGGMACMQQACMGGGGLVGGAGQVPAAAFSSLAAAFGPYLSIGASAASLFLMDLRS